MGSIELFPRTVPRRAAIDAWRATPLGSGTVRVREARFEDYAALRALQKRASNAASPCTLRQFESRLQGFPAGQLVAVIEGQIVGAASALVLHWDDYGPAPTWATLTGDGYYTTHDADGTTLYGAEVFVDNTQRGFGAGRALLQSWRRLCRRLNLRRLATTLSLPGYDALADRMTPERYAMRISWGEVADSSWRFLTAQGFQYCGVLHAFRPDDKASAGNAALLAWLNPMYAPPGPPAFEESERPRKCA